MDICDITNISLPVIGPEICNIGVDVITAPSRAITAASSLSAGAVAVAFGAFCLVAAGIVYLLLRMTWRSTKAVGRGAGRVIGTTAKATGTAVVATGRGVGRAAKTAAVVAAPIAMGVGSAYVGSGGDRQSFYQGLADRLPGSKMKAIPVASMIEHHDHTTAWPDVIDQEHKDGKLTAVIVCAKTPGEAKNKVQSAYVGHQFGQSSAKRCVDSTKTNPRFIYRFTVRK